MGEMLTVKEYEDGRLLRAALGDNELYVDFELVGDDGEVEITGSVKWDGCMNWETNPQVLYHFCSPDDAETLAASFKDVWTEGRKLMPRADKNYGK